MTYRSVCSNGAVVGRTWGEIHWPKGSGHDDGWSPERAFIESLTGLVGEEKKMISPIREMANSYLMGNEFSFLWKSLRKMVGMEEADKLLQATEEDRRKILATAKGNRKDRKPQERVTVCSAYEAFNNISDRANRAIGVSSEKLQRVAGTLLERGRGKVGLHSVEGTEEADDDNA
jgi:hypothetical protein